MPSIFIADRERGDSDVYYSLVDMRVMRCIVRGEVIYDEYSGVAVDGWISKANDAIACSGRKIDANGRLDN